MMNPEASSPLPKLARTRVREGSADACARPQRNNSLFFLVRGFYVNSILVLAHPSPRGYASVPKTE